jgi:hypothetical protein
MYNDGIHFSMEANMNASVVDLRYRMKDILKALDRNEKVTILYHGKKKGIITPITSSTDKSIFQHPFFGMTAGDPEQSVETILDELRDIRY